jgi:hypothetical protein
LLVAPLAFAFDIAKEESKAKVTFWPGKPVVTLRGGKESSWSCRFVWGQAMIKGVARVHTWSGDKGVYSDKGGLGNA